MNVILICYRPSQTSELCHSLEGFICYLLVTILFYSLVKRHEHIVFSAVTAGPMSLLASNRVTVFFFMVFMFLPNKLTSADVSHSFPILSDFWTFRNKLLVHSDLKFYVRMAISE
jgi:hypothetical protein